MKAGSRFDESNLAEEETVLSFGSSWIGVMPAGGLSLTGVMRIGGAGANSGGKSHRATMYRQRQHRRARSQLRVFPESAGFSRVEWDRLFQTSGKSSSFWGLATRAPALEERARSFA